MIAEMRSVARMGSARRCRILLAAGSLVPMLLAAALPSWAEDRSVSFRYALRAESTYDMTMTVSLGMQVSIDGLPEQAAALAALGRDVSQELRMKTVVSTASPDKDGSLPLEGRIADLQGKVTVGGQVIEMQGLADNLVGKAAFRGHVAQDGRVLRLDVEGIEGLASEPKEMLQQLVRALPTLPDRSMKVGDSFEVPFEYELPAFGGGNLATRAVATYTLRSVEDEVATFDLRLAMSAGANGGSSPGMNLDLNGSGLGSAVFDRKEGIFRSVRADITLSMAMDMESPVETTSGGATAADPPGPGATAPPSARRLKIRASAKGPWEITVAPRQPAK